jgi:hypothetical protein
MSGRCISEKDACEFLGRPWHRFAASEVKAAKTLDLIRPPSNGPPRAPIDRRILLKLAKIYATITEEVAHDPGGGYRQGALEKLRLWIDLPKGWYPSKHDPTGLCLSARAAALELGCDEATIRAREKQKLLAAEPEPVPSPHRCVSRLMVDGVPYARCYGLSAIQAFRSNGERSRSLKQLATVKGHLDKSLYARICRAAQKFLSPKPPTASEKDFGFPGLACTRAKESAWTKPKQKKQDLKKAPIMATREAVRAWKVRYAQNILESKKLLKEGYQNTHQLGVSLGTAKDHGRMRELGEMLACYRKYDLGDWATILVPMKVRGSRDSDGYRECQVYEPDAAKRLWEADYLSEGVAVVRELMRAGHTATKEIRTELEKRGIGKKRANAVIKSAKLKREHDGKCWRYVSKATKRDDKAIVTEILQSGLTAGEAKRQARNRGVPHTRFFAIVRDTGWKLDSRVGFRPRHYVQSGRPQPDGHAATRLVADRIAQYPDHVEKPHGRGSGPLKRRAGRRPNPDTWERYKLCHEMLADGKKPEIIISEANRKFTDLPQLEEPAHVYTCANRFNVEKYESIVKNRVAE